MTDAFNLSYTVPVFLGCKKFRKPTLPNLAPIILSLSSYSGTSESTATIYVNGLNFLNNTIVRFSGQECTTFYNSPRQIFFYVPAYPNVGTHTIQVFTASLYSNVVEYSVIL